MSVTNETEVRCPNCGGPCEIVEVRFGERRTDVVLRCQMAWPETDLGVPPNCLPEIVVRVTW